MTVWGMVAFMLRWAVARVIALFLLLLAMAVAIGLLGLIGVTLSMIEGGAH
jgi:hypothetical protein